MLDKSEDQISNEAWVDKGEQIQRLLYRILPFWPLVILTIILSLIGARLYLRYQVPVYQAKARMIVNDITEQKSTNLQEIFKLDTRNLTSETEREMQILSSRDLLAKLVAKLQLNITYIQKGRIRTAPYDVNDLPFRLELENPDTVDRYIRGVAKLTDEGKIDFDGSLFALDSIVPTKFGNIIWRANKDKQKKYPVREVEVLILPVKLAASNVKQSLDIQPISKQSSILDLTYADQIPARAVSILTELINIYGKSSFDYKSRIYENSLQFLESRLRLVSDELSGVEKDLQNYKSKERITDLGLEGSLYLNQLKNSDARIAEIDIQLDVLNQINSYVTKRNISNDSIPATLGFADPVLTNLLSQLYQAEGELMKIRELSGDKNPQVQVWQNTVEKLRSGILNSISNLKANLIASKNTVQDEINRMNGLLNRIPTKERLLLDISRQQAIKNAIYTFLLQKREETAIAGASIVPEYRVIEQPDRGGIISPKPQKIYSTAFIIGMMLLVIFIYLKEFSNKKILFRSQIEEYLPIPVISELVYHEHSLNNPIVVGDGKRTLVAEQFRELRTNINYVTAAASGNKCKVILTTSSIPKEGKSFVSINAAISLSLTGDKVVLLEFDMRKPKISKALGISQEPGLSNYLVGNTTKEAIIKKHPSIDNLTIIPSGPIPPNPTELMTGVKLEELISFLKQHYDFIIIDTPPIAAVTDAKILSKFADATIYIIRHNYTNFIFLNLLKDIYQKKSLRNVSIVFNGIKNKKILGYGYKGYGYGYGYGYSYGYGYTVDERKRKLSIKKLFKKRSG